MTTSPLTGRSLDGLPGPAASHAEGPHAPRRLRFEQRSLRRRLLHYILETHRRRALGQHRGLTFPDEARR